MEGGWEERHDGASGQVYYWNSVTGETSWEPPSLQELAPPWTKAYTDDGRLYYLNTETMETRWTPPDSSESDVLAVTRGRGRRPSTAEQMDELNRLLSGEDEGGEKEEKHAETCVWMMFINESDGVPYYYNQATGECLWDPPEEFLRFHQEQPSEPQPEDVKTTVPPPEPENGPLNEPATQVVVTAEFEEKVRQAIASVSNTPVGSGRLVLPSQEQLAQVTGRSTRSRPGSARPLSGSNSSRPRSGSSRPSSGAAVSRPRPSSGTATSSRLDPLLPTEEAASAENETQGKVEEVGSVQEIKDRVPIAQRAEEITSVADSVGQEDLSTFGGVEAGDEDDVAEHDKPILASVEALLKADADLDIDAKAEPQGDVNVESGSTTEEATEVTCLKAESAALTLQCMIRCFLARRRVKHKRDERQRIKLVVESAAITADTPLPSAITAKEGSNAMLGLPVHETQEEPSPNNVQNSPPEDEPVNDPKEHSPATSSQINAPATIESQQSRSPAFNTRLPSVLDVTKYFPQRRSLASSRPTNTTKSDLVAITRKKVELSSPAHVRRPPQQETSDHEQLVETRKRQEEQAQRAQVVEYRRIYAESRKSFLAEKQRLQEEQQARDNQRQHDLHVEQQSRIQEQRERDTARLKSKTVGNEDQLVWRQMKTQGRPTELSITQFRESVAQALDSVQFPDKMCAERARELHQRIERLRRASWAVDARLEAVELALLSELHPLTDRQRPLQAKYAVKLRLQLENMLNSVQSWQRRLDEWENGSKSTYWSNIEALYGPSSDISSSAASRRQYLLNSWRGAAGGDSLLHVAAWNGWEEHVRALVEEGADVNVVDCSASHRTPLHEACGAGHVSVVELLLRSGARLHAVDYSCDSPLHVACRGGWTRVVRVLLMAANDIEETPMTLEDLFNLRNGKGRRAIDVAVLPSLVEELQNYDYQLNGVQPGIIAAVGDG